MVLTTSIDRQTFFSWTSKGLPVDAISIQGNASGETSDPYLIGVYGVTDVTFSLVATFSQVRSARARRAYVDYVCVVLTSIDGSNSMANENTLPVCVSVCVC